MSAAEREGVELAVGERHRRPVAGEHLVRRQALWHPPCSCPCARSCASASSSVRPFISACDLRQAIGEQQRVMLGHARLMRLAPRSGTRTGMMSVPWCSSWKKACWPLVPGSPQTSGPVAPATGAPSLRHPLAVRFHVELLQIGRQARQALVVGNDGAGRIAADIAVPDADEAQQHGQVAARAARSRKCSSIAWAPSRKRPKFSGPMAIITGRPIADQTE